MKETLLAIGGALFGIGGFCLLSSLPAQDSPNPIMILEIYRQAVFYWLFGTTVLVGLVLLFLGNAK